MSAKDLFSEQAKLYAAFRPDYPKELYDFIFDRLKNKNSAWDCGTGNGQVAAYLSPHFNTVEATDISRQQLDEAFPADNIHYSICPAEKTPFKNATFDLITVAQALHWFDFDAFYAEANRVAKPGALLAVWGYARCVVDDAIEQQLHEFYTQTVGPYWDSARKHVDHHYNDIPFPFHAFTTPEFNIRVQWNIDEFSGYLSTWSSTRTFIKKNGHDPVAPFIEAIRPFWAADVTKTVTFPIFLKLGTIE